MVPASGWKKAFTDATLTIAPVPCSTIAAKAARLARRAMKKFICIAQAKSSSLVPKNPSRRIPAVPCDGTPDQVRRPVWRGQVDRHWRDALNAIEAIDGPRARNDMCALVGQRPGHGQPDALACPSDDRDFAGQVKVHGCSFAEESRRK